MSGGEFQSRHLGIDAPAEREMLAALGLATRAALLDEALPASIRQRAPLELPAPLGEAEALAELRAIAGENEIWRSCIGAGYHACHTPQVIQRNVLENPGWYTAYTPYQAEISQGRLEALLAFQQTVIDLSGLPVANASLLDEATAAAEAMALIRRASKSKAHAFFVDARCHPQVIAVLRTRAKWMGIPLLVDETARVEAAAVFGAHIQYPGTWGELNDPREAITRLHASGGLVSMGTDPLALVLLKSPGALGADVAIGSAQRFGVPLGYGGPHAGYMACRAELVRQMPGRIIGVSVDAAGRDAYRMALQTREQHIRRDKATSNICTAQVLLANIAAFYAIWHGPDGLRRIALRCNEFARLLAAGSKMRPLSESYFDTITFEAGDAARPIRERAEQKRINLRYEGTRVGVALGETTTRQDIADLGWVLTGKEFDSDPVSAAPESIPSGLLREDAILAHPVFHRHRSESEMMRYLKRLENRDYSLVHGMIPLGSCTMKLNAAAEMAPISWPGFAALHPFAPREQARGYARMLGGVSAALAAITGLPHMTLQPNSGANGEFAGLLTIRNYHAEIGRAHV